MGIKWKENQILNLSKRMIYYKNTQQVFLWISLHLTCNVTWTNAYIQTWCKIIRFQEICHKHFENCHSSPSFCYHTGIPNKIWWSFFDTEESGIGKETQEEKKINLEFKKKDEILQGHMNNKCFYKSLHLACNVTWIRIHTHLYAHNYTYMHISRHDTLTARHHFRNKKLLTKWKANINMILKIMPLISLEFFFVWP